MHWMLARVAFYAHLHIIFFLRHRKWNGNLSQRDLCFRFRANQVVAVVVEVVVTAAVTLIVIFFSVCTVSLFIRSTWWVCMCVCVCARAVALFSHISLAQWLDSMVIGFFIYFFWLLFPFRLRSFSHESKMRKSTDKFVTLSLTKCTNASVKSNSHEKEKIKEMKKK